MRAGTTMAAGPLDLWQRRGAQRGELCVEARGAGVEGRDGGTAVRGVCRPRASGSGVFGVPGRGKPPQGDPGRDGVWGSRLLCRLRERHCNAGVRGWRLKPMSRPSTRA